MLRIPSLFCRSYQ